MGANLSQKEQEKTTAIAESSAITMGLIDDYKILVKLGMGAPLNCLKKREAMVKKETFDMLEKKNFKARDSAMVKLSFLQVRILAKKESMKLQQRINVLENERKAKSEENMKLRQRVSVLENKQIDGKEENMKLRQLINVLENELIVEREKNLKLREVVLENKQMVEKKYIKLGHS